MNFHEAEKLFRSDQIVTLAGHQDGLRYLKLRSLSRRDYLEALLRCASIEVDDVPAKELFRLAFESSPVTPSLIDRVIGDVYEAERSTRREGESDLINELYRLQAFDWGGLHQNSLEKTIVDNYVKKIRNYDLLCDKIENDLHNSLRGYVLCSWYNNWTSIVIEDIFRDHPKVLPAVGKVKKIDFFIGDVPFDLKVTYLPEGFIAEQRKAEDKGSELTLLKKSARKHGIPIDKQLPNARCLEDLWAKHRDHPGADAQGLVRALAEYRKELVAACQRDPTILIRWLYENQGIRRFDASNRLFLMLVDTENFFESWKLKRAKPLLAECVKSYLDGLGSQPGREVEFGWDGEKHTTRADIAFAIRP